MPSNQQLNQSLKTFKSISKPTVEDWVNLIEIGKYEISHGKIIAWRSVEIDNSFLNDGLLFFPFETVYGTFTVRNLANDVGAKGVSSLRGFPERVTGSVFIEHGTFKTLKNFPKSGDDITIGENYVLDSADGIEKIVRG